MPETILGLLLAAGQSLRMGAFKPLLPLRDRTVLENAVDSLFSGGADAVVAVVGHRGAELEALLHERFGARTRVVHNPDYARTDMLRSIQIGCRALPDCGAFFLLPGDMPFVQRSTFEKLLRAREKGRAVFPEQNGRRGHPPLIDSRLIPEILAYEGPDGLRGFWRRHAEEIRAVPVDDEGVLLDLDTPEAYVRCRRRYHQ